MVGAIGAVWGLWTAGAAEAATHTFALRLRHGGVPQGIMDVWFFDSDDPGALAYDRPAIGVNVVGLEYTLAPSPVGTSLVVWAERAWTPMKAGYWDDVESPEDHLDGDWIEPDGLGLWALGVNYAHEIGVTPQTAPVWFGVVLGAGIGGGYRTGTITVWHPGYHEDSLAPDCLYESSAPDRVDSCPNDGTADMPRFVPILDVTASAKLHITEHAMVRLDLGLHDVPYIGGAAGGSF